MEKEKHATEISASVNLAQAQTDVGIVQTRPNTLSHFTMAGGYSKSFTLCSLLDC